MELKGMRILHVTNNLGIGGVQKIIFEICDATKDKMDKIIVASTGGEYVNRLEEIGIEHKFIPDLSTKDPKQIKKIYLALNDIVKNNNIDFIHCHHRMAVPYARIIVGKKHVIYNNHTIYSDKRLFSHLVLNGVNIIADGEKAKKNVTDFFKINRNIIVINNAVDDFDGLIYTIPEIKEARDEGKFIVMNSARLHPQKGMQYFINAAEILINKGLNIQFFIVGDGPLREELIDLVLNKHLEKRITFLGFRMDIKSTISQCDVLVLTSIYEGLPLTPMEAFSVHKAVIGTNIDGTKEVIKNGLNGLLAESKNPNDIAEKISIVYHDRNLLEKLSSSAYESYLDLYSNRTLAQAYLHFYSSLSR